MIKQLYLFPGTLAASSDPAEMITLLGSCVAVALHDPQLNISGLNHYLLPRPLSGDTPSPRYGSFALPALVRELELLGARAERLQAKVFGGANVLKAVDIGADIGRANVEIAVSFLEGAKIPIIERSVGGSHGRRISLRTDTFEIAHMFQGVSVKKTG